MGTATGSKGAQKRAQCMGFKPLQVWAHFQAARERRSALKGELRGTNIKMRLDRISVHGFHGVCQVTLGFAPPGLLPGLLSASGAGSTTARVSAGVRPASLRPLDCC